jgi:hypothetical protein
MKEITLDIAVDQIHLTTNFDDLLSRSLSLFGIPDLVCSHPRTVERINPENQDIQIIYVHGTYWFYDCCNLRDEIQGWALTSPETTLTMGALIDRIVFLTQPPNVNHGNRNCCAPVAFRIFSTAEPALNVRNQ